MYSLSPHPLHRIRHRTITASTMAEYFLLGFTSFLVSSSADPEAPPSLNSEVWSGRSGLRRRRRSPLGSSQRYEAREMLRRRRPVVRRRGSSSQTVRASSTAPRTKLTHSLPRLCRRPSALLFFPSLTCRRNHRLRRAARATAPPSIGLPVWSNRRRRRRRARRGVTKSPRSLASGTLRARPREGEGSSACTEWPSAALARMRIP